LENNKTTMFKTILQVLFRGHDQARVRRRLIVAELTIGTVVLVFLILLIWNALIA